MKTDSDLGTSFIIYETQSGTGLITQATYVTTPPTTASKFAVGCKVTDTTLGITYVNRGTVAVPVWDTEIISKTMLVTAAQIISNYTTSLEVIPAVPGKAIILDSFVFDLTGTATQFTGGGVVNLQYDSTANGAGTTLHADIAASVITGATARVITVRIPKDLSAIATASITGLGVYLGTKTAVFAAGTGTAVLKVKYHLI